MLFYDRDLAALQAGEPPYSPEWLQGLTLGREVWLDTFKRHYLQNYIASGGSKVKVLVGSEGIGKTHLLRCVEADARSLGYAAVYLSVREMECRINDLPNLYRSIFQGLNLTALVKGLCLKVAERLGYGKERYQGEGRLLPLLIEDGFARYDAEREIRNAAVRTFREIDFGPSFVTFAYTTAYDGLTAGMDSDLFQLRLKWLSGEKLDKQEQQETGLLEQLKRVNARYWLNSLIRLLEQAGMPGLVVLIDDLEAITERVPETGRFRYTPNAIKDTCELFRQMIDDVELLNGLLVVLSGQRAIIDNERRGFKSYEALWMRLQTGLVPSTRFNPFADIVDVDAHYDAVGDDFPERLSARLSQFFKQKGFERRYREGMPDTSQESVLRRAVMENALLAARSEESHGTI
ncbi:BREX system ATP-binding domain-containing protein [Sporomusa acidovorans]|uniref:ATP-binding protein n=1 Tax=Sporomusa acidovorans (strain ATCC 49682 / DSM 3132 / Mol) TaxID=1123286 RepID=A0ABZ3J7N8_SPOA4|nr:BREX system ATP-binding domain-containing protein [Sporomusa acidovorans]OZC19379.1 hypothetical protein SPACI_29690 [Sporomusa acidovorans DSM 3132]SDD78667.1 P-loop protein of unknown function [Sporomusa acidovorans]